MLISGGAMNESRARLWEIADKLRERHLRVELPELLDEALARMSTYYCAPSEDPTMANSVFQEALASSSRLWPNG
jgi:hypothetical protein